MSGGRGVDVEKIRADVVVVTLPYSLPPLDVASSDSRAQQSVEQLGRWLHDLLYSLKLAGEHMSVQTVIIRHATRSQAMRVMEVAQLTGEHRQRLGEESGSGGQRQGRSYYELVESSERLVGSGDDAGPGFGVWVLQRQSSTKGRRSTIVERRGASAAEDDVSDGSETGTQKGRVQTRAIYAEHTVVSDLR
jgi:hypothetical protein